VVKKYLDYFKKYNKLMYLIMFLFLGIGLMYVPNALMRENDAVPLVELRDVTNTAQTPSTYESELESRLTAVLERAEGVGEVSVIITLTQKDEIILANDVIYDKSETNSAGGAGTNLSERREARHVLQQQQGYNEPIVIKRISPKVEGVIIVAEGGDNAYVKSQLIKAACVVLNVPPHKVEVMKMR
jgi:stage III sporulation protein AG